MRPPDEEKLKGLLVEFEFNSIGRRLFGEDFKAGRGGGVAKPEVRSPKSTSSQRGIEQLVLVGEAEGTDEELAQPARPGPPTLRPSPMWHTSITW